MYVEKFPEDKKYKTIQTFQASIFKGSVFSEDPSEDDANYLLRKMALEAGADAIVDIYYQTGMNLISPKYLKANGIAVKYLD